jgi:hypothetical protein
MPGTARGTGAPQRKFALKFLRFDLGLSSRTYFTTMGSEREEDLHSTQKRKFLLTQAEARWQRSIRRDERTSSGILDQPAGGCLSGHPPDGRDERRTNHSLDERDALSQGASRQDGTSDHLRG